MESAWGMGRTISVHGELHRVGISGGGGGKPGEKENDQPDPALAERIEKHLQEQYALVERLLARNRLAILSVAHALETYRTLSGEDVAAVIDCTRGPLVNGRMYAEAGEELEAYHAACVEAHRNKSGSTIPLPKFEGGRT